LRCVSWPSRLGHAQTWEYGRGKREPVREREINVDSTVLQIKVVYEDGDLLYDSGHLEAASEQNEPPSISKGKPTLREPWAGAM